MNFDYLTPTTSDREFAGLPPLEGTQGDHVEVAASSATNGPHIWLSASNPHGGRTRRVSVHLDAETAWKLSDQLRFLVANHYQGNATPEWAAK